MINDSALNYWRHTGYVRADLVRIMERMDSSQLAALVDFEPEGKIKIGITSTVERRREGHFPTMLALIADIHEHHLKGEVQGSFIFWLEDGMWPWYEDIARQVPILAFGRRVTDFCTMLIPDPAFLGSRAYSEERSQIRDLDSALPWKQKQNCLFWRGASSGLEKGLDNQRVKLCLEAKKLGVPGMADVGISKVVEQDTEFARQAKDLGILKLPVPFNDFLRYRYQADVDGFSCAWKSLYLKLSSDCTVLKVQSDKEQWYYDRLKPWVHYVPLNADSSNLEEILNWCFSHEDACEQIASNAGNLMRTLNFEDETKFTADTLRELLPCQRG